MLSIFNNLKIAQRLALAASTFAVPLVYLLWALVSEQNIAIDFADQEVKGTFYLHAIAEVQSAAAVNALGGARHAPLADHVPRAAACTQNATTHIQGVRDAASTASAGAVDVLGAAGVVAAQSDGIIAVVSDFVAGLQAA
jgi:hypothetical protein